MGRFHLLQRHLHRRLSAALGRALPAIGRAALALSLSVAIAEADGGSGSSAPPLPEAGAIRLAAFNVSLKRRNPGELAQELRLGGSPQVDAVVEIVQRVRPDILLVNEIDHDRRGVAASLFADALREGRGGAEGIAYDHVFAAPSNTGVASGFDLDGDGRQSGPRDAFGFGYFVGQSGMALLSRFPIESETVRTFQTLLWADMPGNIMPAEHFGEAAGHLRLSSRSHWDAPVLLPDGRRLHLLASHPTPPVFDGPEDANGRRNHDEIRFWVDYVQGRSWMTDDAGASGGLPEGDAFAVLGTLNADPADGAAERAALLSLIALAQDPHPASAGGVEAAEAGGANARHRSPPSEDTADWRDEPGPGNLRSDYVLPSKAFAVVAAGVFWPVKEDPLRRLVGEGAEVSSDHRLVWVDIK